MFCHHCGVKLIEGSQFCHGCGTKVVSSVDGESQPTPTYTAAPVPSNFYQEPIAPSSEKKGTPFIVIGWVSFGLTLLFFMTPVVIPIIFGILALIMGILVIKVRNQIHGVILSILAVVGTLSSIGIGQLVRTLIAHYYY